MQFTAFTGWLKMGDFCYVEQREVLEPDQITCAEQANADS